MFGEPRPAKLRKMEVGMVDPYINERVTHTAELDESACRRQSRVAILPFLIITIIFPCICIFACILWVINERHTTAIIRGTQVYLTEHTLVYVIANQPIESSRVTIPLSNIASVMVQPGVKTVNIKPTAPEVMLNRCIASEDRGSITTTVVTCSVPIYNVHNAVEFSKVIQSHLH